MSALCYFVGGPINGRTEVRDTAFPQIHFYEPGSTMIAQWLTKDSPPFSPIRQVTYQRLGYRLPDGGEVYVFVFAGRNEDEEHVKRLKAEARVRELEAKLERVQRVAKT